METWVKQYINGKIMIENHKKENMQIK